MKTIELSSQLEWEKIIENLKNEDVVFTRHGHAVALLSDFDDDELYWYNRERSPEFQASMERAREQMRQGKVTSHEDLKRELGID
ncbi:MAG: hypothetical protein FJ271_17970 [Planctomycetes bacterium]|nr:hypothetical protein [Planctomycetota bacterium]